MKLAYIDRSLIDKAVITHHIAVLLIIIDFIEMWEIASSGFSGQ